MTLFYLIYKNRNKIGFHQFLCHSDAIKDIFHDNINQQIKYGKRNIRDIYHFVQII